MNLGGEALFVSYDMGKQGDWQRVISITLNAFSRIDMLFQNAGLYKIDSIFLANKRTIPMYFVLMTFG